MKKIITLILVTMFFQSCGAIFPKDKIKKLKPIFSTSNPYFDENKASFEQLYYEHTGQSIDSSSLPINFSEKEFESLGNSIGVCYYTETNGKFQALEIIIKESTWKKLSNNCREYLINHELGHCLLNKDHTEGHPSIMNPQITYCEYYSMYSNLFNEEFLQNDNIAIEALKYFLQ